MVKINSYKTCIHKIYSVFKSLLSLFWLIKLLIIWSSDFATRVLCSQRLFLSMRVIAQSCSLNRSGGSEPKLALLEYQAPKRPHCMLRSHNAIACLSVQGVWVRVYVCKCAHCRVCMKNTETSVRSGQSVPGQCRLFSCSWTPSTSKKACLAQKNPTNFEAMLTANTKGLH